MQACGQIATHLCRRCIQEPYKLQHRNCRCHAQRSALTKLPHMRGHTNYKLGWPCACILLRIQAGPYYPDQPCADTGIEAQHCCLSRQGL